MSPPAPVALLRPAWPAPRGVHAAFSLRTGGSSAPPWASLNLGTHVGDDLAAVTENRRRLALALDLPAEPLWLEQVHGVQVWRPLPEQPVPPPPRADAIVVDRPGVVAAIMVADCIPVLLCDRAGSIVAAAHAGWRGLAAGVLERTVAAMDRPAAELLAWLGPAIGAARFEVGEEVREAFPSGAGAPQRFRPGRTGRWLCDLPGLARDRLQALGVGAVSGGEWCTASDPERFFSHRRDAPRTGRMAALVWLGDVRM